MRSICDRQRWNAALGRDRTAPFCDDCVRDVRLIVSAALDWIVDAEADAGYAEQDLHARLVEGEARELDGNR